ncbi:hypothetical protein [Salinibacterium sp. ZJ77]|uniref:hypothetical protein n=1 Tax=Salinibacterium sp. ZJ77 TaxID=2708337 RepID=UPI0014229785|nr:hypothetical protein [Salinibacterium sp. ZJ77]
MQVNRVRDRARALIDDAGTSSPTPLFIAFVTTLALAALFAYRGGPSATATLDFLVLAATVSAAALGAFGGLVLWATRAGHRAANLAAVRPGALVIRSTRVAGLRQALRTLRPRPPFVPFGLTLLADDTGVELWAGSAEHPLRFGRVPWEAVAGIRVTHVTRWGRAADGISVSLLDGTHGAAVELPFALVGSGLAGLFTPPREELDALVAELERRRLASYATL